MSTSTGVAGPRTSFRATDRSQEKPKLPRKMVIFGLIILVTLCVVGILAFRYWPFSEKEIRQDLAEASDSKVTIRSYHPTYFPPGCILEGIEFRHGDKNFKLITIDKLIVRGSYLGILRRHVPQITSDGAIVFVPPFGSALTFHSQHSDIVVDNLVANGTAVEFLSADGRKPSLVFDVHEALLSGVRWGNAMQYRLKLHNPNPSGELRVEGKFGPWADGHPQDTPLSGNYTFNHADLSAYEGIAGILTSAGKFDGVFKHIDIAGTTDTPDFVVKSGGHKHSLSTHFEAYVDAMHGDTFLKRVEAHLGRTLLLAHGSIAGSPGKKGKTADLHFNSQHARIEDILGLFVSAPRSPMSGDLSLVAHAQLPENDQSFLERVRLDGQFGIDDGTFKPETQKDVNELSAGARGQNKDEPETVVTDLKGAFRLIGGVANFSDLDFGVPGAHARLHGTYNIINHRVGLHGEMLVDTKISKTSSGVKALLLKVMDPIFRKKKKGEIVPIYILGTYEKPQFGLDLGNNNQKSK